jgi:deoxyribodipyrimidine photo-lyase
MEDRTVTDRPIIVWFRRDLRLDDHSALSAAVARGGPVVPVFVWDGSSEGAAGRWWLHHSLVCLEESLNRLGSPLVVRSGHALDVLPKIVKDSGADAVFCVRSYEPGESAIESETAAAVESAGAEFRRFDGPLLFPPESIQTGGGTPYKVFTPFWKACLAASSPSKPSEPPRELPAPKRPLVSASIDSLELLPKIDWAAGFREAWTPGEDGAHAALAGFLDGAAADYKTHRDRPDLRGTSRLSPHLHFGEISPRRVWNDATKHLDTAAGKRSRTGVDAFLRQLGWREFAGHLLFHFPHTIDEPLRTEFAEFPWNDDAAHLKAWQKGQTGYPIVDAGMRELWTTGWLHNRVRMVVASFLVKDLLISWTEGAGWFADTLVDADLANNTLGWQWTAGCGADAAPFFRVFNPMMQGEKFDPNGDYVRRWVPEIKKLPTKWIHKPFQAPDKILAEAGVRLGDTYPRPVVDHFAARDRALAALEQTKKSQGRDSRGKGGQR